MLKKRLDSFRFALAGLRELFSGTANARIHATLSALAIGLGLALHISKNEWFAIIGCIMLVISLEAVNTAIENIIDLISPGQHTLAGKAKDLAAGAVLWAAIGAAVIGALVFLPKILTYFS